MNKLVQRFAIAAMLGLASGLVCAQLPLLAQNGNAAGTEGGAGTAGQTGTPPGELSADQARREQAGRANQKAAQHGRQRQQGASAPDGASHAH
jgi:hypothetical protein